MDYLIQAFENDRGLLGTQNQTLVKEAKSMVKVTEQTPTGNSIYCSFTISYENSSVSFGKMYFVCDLKQIAKKFASNCEWYKDGEIYEVYKSLGDYIVVGLEWGIRKRDAVIIEKQL